MAWLCSGLATALYDCSPRYVDTPFGQSAHALHLQGHEKSLQATITNTAVVVDYMRLELQEVSVENTSFRFQLNKGLEVSQSFAEWICIRGPTSPRIVLHAAVQVEVSVSSTKVCRTVLTVHYYPLAGVQAKVSSRHRMHLFGRRKVKMVLEKFAFA